MGIVLTAFVAFVCLSGVAAAVDAAVLSVSRAEVEEMVVQRRWGAGWLKRAKLEIGRTIVVVVILTNVVNVLGPILVGGLAASFYGETGLRFATAAMVVGTVVFSEIVPKSLGTHYAPVVGRVSAPVLVALEVALRPLVVVLEGISRSLRRPGARPVGTEDQIRSLVVIGRRGEHIESDEARMIHRAFVLNDRTAADLAVPLEEVVAFRPETTLREAADTVARSAFSRYPVLGKSNDEVCGLVLGRDVLRERLTADPAETIGGIVRPVPVVAATRRCDELLALFRDEHVHLAVVRTDEGTAGIVTLEDVLEQLVGSIEDEKDVRR